MDTIILFYSGIVLLAVIFGFFVGAAWGINKGGMRTYADMKELAQSYNKAYSEAIALYNFSNHRKQEPAQEMPPIEGDPTMTDYDTALMGGRLE